MGPCNPQEREDLNIDVVAVLPLSVLFEGEAVVAPAADIADR